ncbi:MAG: Crp/Fnr family transcriptional regulator [Solirubrobacteraceae bacterium]
MHECTAPAFRVERRWDGERIHLAEGGIGLLVLQGLLIRRVGIDGRFGAELLGDGDLLRPWQGEDEQAQLRCKTTWRVLEPSRIAVLNRRVTDRFARYPGLIEGLVGRALARSRKLAVNLAIVQHPRVDVRLLMLFWHLADRWAGSTPDGIYLPLPLTHGLLAELVAARRPTVTRALSGLAQRGLVRVVDDVWLLSGEPPRELLELRAAAGRSLA